MTTSNVSFIINRNDGGKHVRNNETSIVCTTRHRIKMDRLNQPFKASKSALLSIYHIGNVPAISNDSARHRRPFLSGIYFLPFSLSLFLSLPPFTRSVIVDTSVARYIASIMEICTPAKYYSVGDPSRSRSLFPHYSARSFVRSFFDRFCATVRLYARASMLRNANTRKGTKPRERVNERARPCTHGKFGASPTKTPKKLGGERGRKKN